MKEILDVEILIRCFNEEEWIIRCLEAIEKQTYHPKKITVINNYSTDSSGARIDFYKNSSKLNIEHSLYKNSTSTYLPGKCLNTYIKEVNSEYTIFLSAHCIPANFDWLINLYGSFESDEAIIAAYGRQIPTKKSDPRDARDLLWTFGKEEKINKKDIFFHNANSIARTSILQEFPFENDLTNIEDRVWAHQLLSLNKFFIKYNPESIVFHEHGIHQSGKIQRANQIISIVNKTTDKLNLNLPKSNLGCFIPYKASDNSYSDFTKIEKTIQVAKDLGFEESNIICSVEGNIELVKKFNSPIVQKRVLNDSEKNKKRGLREILMSINETCEKSNKFFDDILLMEPNYTSRSTKTIKKLISDYYDSPCSVGMVSLPLKPHIWKVTKSKLIRLDSYELNANFQESITLSMRGLGMIFKIGQLRKESWLDDDIQFVEINNALECIPQDS